MCDKVLNEYDPNMTEAMKAKGEAHILKEEYDEGMLPQIVSSHSKSY